MPSRVFTDNRVVSGQELSRLSDAVQGRYVFPSDAGGAVTTNSNMAPSVAAITAQRVIVNYVLDTTGYGGATQTVATADVTNPRRDVIWYDGAGAIGITAGTAAANPVLPDLTAGRIAIAEIYVATNDTSIDAGDIIDLRQHSHMGTGWQVIARANAAATTTATSLTTLVTLSTDIYGNALSIPLHKWVRIRGNARKTATNAQAVAFGLTLNATAIYDGTNYMSRSSATNRAEDGIFEVIIGPRSSANYLNGGWALHRWGVSATGADAVAVAHLSVTTNPLPNAALTSIIVNAINETANNNAEVYNITVEIS